MRNRANNDLHLDVLALPKVGIPHQPMVPRQRPQTQLPQSRRQSTAHLDTQAIGALRNFIHPSLSRDHQCPKTVDDRLLVSKIREGNPRKLEPLPKRPPLRPSVCKIHHYHLAKDHHLEHCHRSKEKQYKQRKSLKL